MNLTLRYFPLKADSNAEKEAKHAKTVENMHLYRVVCVETDRSDQTGEVSSKKEQLSMKKKSICEDEKSGENANPTEEQWATSWFHDIDLLYLQPTVKS